MNTHNKTPNTFLLVFIESQKRKLKETRRIFNPLSPEMKAVQKELDETCSWVFMPVWKKVLIKLKLMKR